MVAEQNITGYEYRKLEREIERLKQSNERLIEKYVSRYNWRVALDTVSTKLLSPTEKLLACILQDKIFLEREEDSNGFYSVRIGQKPYKNNLMGMSGMSKDTISKTLMVFQTSGLIERKLIPGTREEEYKNAELLIKPTELWKPETLRRIEERNHGGKRVALCPHCQSTDIKPSEYTCTSCGSIFDEPLYMVVDEDGNEKVNKSKHELYILPSTPEPETTQEIEPELTVSNLPPCPACHHNLRVYHIEGEQYGCNKCDELFYHLGLGEEVQEEASPASMSEKELLPDWLIPGTKSWDKAVLKYGVEEMQSRRKSFLASQGK